MARPSQDLCARAVLLGGHADLPLPHSRPARLLWLRHLAQQGEPAGATATACQRPLRGVPQRQPGGDSAGSAAQPSACRRAAGHRHPRGQEMTPMGGGPVVLAVPTHPPDPCVARAARVRGSIQGCSLFPAERGGAGPLPPSTGEQLSAPSPSARCAQRELCPHPVPLRPPRCHAANPLFPAHPHRPAWMEDGDGQRAHPSLILASAAALLSPVLLFPLPASMASPLQCQH